LITTLAVVLLQYVRHPELQDCLTLSSAISLVVQKTERDAEKIAMSLEQEMRKRIARYAD
jgi:hypothetical protein